MPGLRERIILRGIRMHYTGSPTIVVTLDGENVSTISDLPTHTTYKTRVVTLPQGYYGFIPHYTSDSTDLMDAEFMAENPATYNAQNLWHYYEVTYTGTVNVSLYVDEDLKLGDGDGQDSTKSKKTLVASRNQETTKVYLPPLSYGRVPHVLNDTSDQGEIIRWTPVVLPARFYSTLAGVGEGKITFRGECFVDFFLDGERIGEGYHFVSEKDRNGEFAYSSQVFYFNENTSGRVFQYEQTSGEGDILLVETDAHPVDVEPQSKEEPM